MAYARSFSLFLVMTLMSGALVSCRRAPSLRKQEYFQSGARYFEKGKYREAILQFQNALQVDPGYLDAHYQLARCYLRIGNPSRAYNHLVRTVERQPDNWGAQIDLGKLLLAEHKYKQAQEKAQRILSGQPNNVDAHALLATAQAAMGDQEGSLREMQKAIQIAPNRWQSYLELALLQVNVKQASAAEENYKKAISLDPHAAGPVLALGEFYVAQHRFNEAEQQLRRATQVEPKNPQPFAMLARLYLTLGQKDKAEAALKEGKQVSKDNAEGYRMLGDYYLGIGEEEEALGEYASLLREHPQDLRVKKNYVQLLILRNRLEEATTLNNEILKRNANDVDSLICRGQILTRQGHSNDAIRPLESALETEPDNAVAHYFLGIANSQLGNLQRAESECREAARLRPEMSEAQQALAGVALRKGDVDQVYESGEALIKAEPSSPLGYVLRGTAKLSRKDIAGGEDDFNKAIKVAPRNPLGYARLAAWRFATKRFDEAEKLYERALELDPNFAAALEGLLEVYGPSKQPSKVLARVKAQIARAPNNSIYYLLLAKALLIEKDVERAEAAAQKAADLDKTNLQALLLLGELQGARGSAEKAIATYQQSIQTNPRDVRAYVLLGELEHERGNWQMARAEYQKALQVQPDYPPAANNLAYLMLEHGLNTDLALSLAQAARRGLPASPAAADTLGWALYNKGAYRSAIDLLEEATKKAPQNANTHFHLGMAYAKMGNRERAKTELERTLHIDPNYGGAGDLRQLLAPQGPQ